MLSADSLLEQLQDPTIDFEFGDVQEILDKLSTEPVKNDSDTKTDAIIQNNESVTEASVKNEGNENQSTTELQVKKSSQNISVDGPTFGQPGDRSVVEAPSPTQQVEEPIPVRLNKRKSKKKKKSRKQVASSGVAEKARGKEAAGCEDRTGEERAGARENPAPTSWTTVRNSRRNKHNFSPERRSPEPEEEEDIAIDTAQDDKKTPVDKTYTLVDKTDYLAETTVDPEGNETKLGQSLEEMKNLFFQEKDVEIIELPPTEPAAEPRPRKTKKKHKTRERPEPRPGEPAARKVEVKTGSRKQSREGGGGGAGGVSGAAGGLPLLFFHPLYSGEGVAGEEGGPPLGLLDPGYSPHFVPNYSQYSSYSPGLNYIRQEAREFSPLVTQVEERLASLNLLGRPSNDHGPPVHFTDCQPSY